MEKIWTVCIIGTNEVTHLFFCFQAHCHIVFINGENLNSVYYRYKRSNTIAHYHFLISRMSYRENCQVCIIGLNEGTLVLTTVAFLNDGRCRLRIEEKNCKVCIFRYKRSNTFTHCHLSIFFMLFMISNQQMIIVGKKFQKWGPTIRLSPHSSIKSYLFLLCRFWQFKDSRSATQCFCVVKK